MTDGAIDHEFDDAERSPEEQLAAAMADLDARPHGEWEVRDVAIDLISRQPLVVIDIAAETVVEYYEREEFDLATYNQHAWLPVTPEDTVLECVFVGGLDDLHKFSDTYSYPEGRLARVPIELAGGDNA